MFRALQLNQPNAKFAIRPFQLNDEPDIIRLWTQCGLVVPQNRPEKDIRLKFTHKGLELNRKLPIHIRQNLFLIFKEAINNIYKHSNASVVKVNLSNLQNEFIMKITDDGDGYNPALVKNGSGLKNMQMRAKRIGAKIEMNTYDGVELLLTLNKI